MRYDVNGLMVWGYGFFVSWRVFLEYVCFINLVIVGVIREIGYLFIIWK